MIDIHTHILPDLDDGPKGVDEAVALAQAMARDGVTSVLATPHHHALLGETPQAELHRRIRELEEILAAKEIPLHIHPGAENSITPDLPRQVEEGTAFPLGLGPYILVELPFQTFPPYTEQVLFQLQAQGYTPILAHPERNAALLKDPRLLERLVERSVLAQVTAASLWGGFGDSIRKAAEHFVRNGWVHLIASDAHSASDNRLPLSAGVEAAARLVGRQRAQAMVTSAPEAVLTGKPVKVATLSAEPRRVAWAFWRAGP